MTRGRCLAATLAALPLGCRARTPRNLDRSDVVAPVALDAPTRATADAHADDDRWNTNDLPAPSWRATAAPGATLRVLPGGCERGVRLEPAATLAPGDAFELGASAGPRVGVPSASVLVGDLSLRATASGTRVGKGAEEAVTALLARGALEVSNARGRGEAARVDTPLGRLVLTDGRAEIEVSRAALRVTTLGAEATLWRVVQGRPRVERLPPRSTRRWTIDVDLERVAREALEAAARAQRGDGGDDAAAIVSLSLGAAAAAALLPPLSQGALCEGQRARRRALERSGAAIAR